MQSTANAAVTIPVRPGSARSTLEELPTEARAEDLVYLWTLSKFDPLKWLEEFHLTRENGLTSGESVFESARAEYNRYRSKKVRAEGSAFSEEVLTVIATASRNSKSSSLPNLNHIESYRAQWDRFSRFDQWARILTAWEVEALKLIFCTEKTMDEIATNLDTYKMRISRLKKKCVNNAVICLSIK